MENALQSNIVYGTEENARSGRADFSRLHFLVLRLNLVDCTRRANIYSIVRRNQFSAYIYVFIAIVAIFRFLYKMKIKINIAGAIRRYCVTANVCVVCYLML